MTKLKPLFLKKLHEPEGFTLVEILVAATILFSVVTLCTLIYRSSISYLEKCNASIRVSESFYYIKNNILSSLQEGKTKGTGRYGGNIKYLWEARLVKSGRNVVGLSETGAGVRYGSFVLNLYRIRLNIFYSSPDGTNKKTESFLYNELVWENTRG